MTHLAVRPAGKSAQAGRKHRQRLVDGEQGRGRDVFRGGPLGERHRDRAVSPRRRVHLVDGCEPLSGNRPASRTSAGHTRRWTRVTLPLTKRVATTSPEASRSSSTLKIS